MICHNCGCREFYTVNPPKCVKCGTVRREDSKRLNETDSDSFNTAVTHNLLFGNSSSSWSSDSCSRSDSYSSSSDSSSSDSGSCSSSD